MVRIAAAGPVAQRHRGRDAALARMDLAAVVRGQQAEVEHVGLHAAALEHLARELRQPPGLGDLAGTGAVVARRTIDQQHARVAFERV